ncbi:MAG TPA: cytochrome c [Flavisolibacter sp.]|jgi:mono/diheme cytochrome c family protein
MKKLAVITGILGITAAFVGCGGAKGEDPGEHYAPDMVYSRAYETYGYNSRPEDHDLKSRGAYYNGKPVAGTMARGDAFTFPIAEGDSGYQQSINYRSPMQGVVYTPAQVKEGERLYQVNCAICHGTKLDGNGPLWKDGEGPYPAKPQVLNGDYAKKLSDGQMYHVITYGKGQMGSYASQLFPEQRWWVINYMRSKQGPLTGSDSSNTAAPATATAGGGSTAAATK